MTLRELLALERQAVRRERLTHLFDRLATEVRDGDELVLRLRREVADRLDADALEAVVRAHAELELLDGEVLHPVRDGSLDRGLGHSLAEALDALDVGEDRELPDEDLRRLPDRLARLDRAVGRDVEDELVVVGALPDTSCLDLVGNAAHR